MAKRTQPHGYAISTRRYAFTAKTPYTPAFGPHPVARITQPHGYAISTRRYGSFAGKASGTGIAATVFVVPAGTVGATNIRVLSNHTTKVKVTINTTDQKVAVIQDSGAVPVQVII